MNTPQYPSIFVIGLGRFRVTHSSRLRTAKLRSACSRVQGTNQPAPVGGTTPRSQCSCTMGSQHSPSHAHNRRSVALEWAWEAGALEWAWEVSVVSEWAWEAWEWDCSSNLRRRCQLVSPEGTHLCHNALRSHRGLAPRSSNLRGCGFYRTATSCKKNAGCHSPPTRRQ